MSAPVRSSAARLAVGLLALFTLLLTACAPIAPAGPTAAAPTGPADPEAVFRWANAVGLSRFDPHRATSSNDNTHLFLTYDRLVHTDADGQPVPGLATDWAFSADGLALDLALREGVAFHDGVPFDAAAVRANIERAKTVEGSAVAPELAAVESVEVTGAHAVRLHLNAPNAALPLVLSDRAGAMVSPAAFDDPGLDQNPVGAGMFRVTDYQPGARISYRAAPGYWDPGAVRVAGVDMVIYTDPVTRLNALRTGETDATVLSPDQVEEARATGIRVEPGRTTNFWYFQPNRARSEFADVRVRRALWHAIDRQALVDALARGYGELSAQPVPEWSFAHDPGIGPDPYPHDPQRARDLLAEAGLADGFTFEALVSASPDVQRHAEAIQADLAAVGITMQMRVLEGAQITDVFFGREEGDLLLGPGGGRPDPAQTTGLRYTPGGFMNPGDHTTPELQRLQQEVLAATDPQQRTAAFHDLMAEFVDAAPEVILYYATPPVALSPQVLHFEPGLADRPEFRGVAKAGV
ncbi:ABC transporter substrate-binding protein [Pseudonocardia kunmingensis]|uniref:Peptide/nickel transport system substrate-binding protein n=1 Tax=Pseudonocardia kunmingensis TaxID=630975 RepID=A0A543DRJ5_9PSEU|nr:ABC transporter substrate-binding protein [Pseudonocardia kunmingensis]TQM11957.1 peptide/nickel transport system substrate-binding protein [Pseudonocardia kunmingensis]